MALLTSTIPCRAAVGSSLFEHSYFVRVYAYLLSHLVLPASLSVTLLPFHFLSPSPSLLPPCPRSLTPHQLTGAAVTVTHPPQTTAAAAALPVPATRRLVWDARRQRLCSGRRRRFLSEPRAPVAVICSNDGDSDGNDRDGSDSDSSSGDGGGDGTVAVEMAIIAAVMTVTVAVAVTAARQARM